MNKKLSNTAAELIKIDMLAYFNFLFRIPKSRHFDNEIYYQIYNTNKRYNNIWGGRGSGKSNEVFGKLPIVLISCLPFCRVLMLRQINATHRTSTFQEVRDYITKWKLDKYFKVTVAPMQVTCLLNGNYIIWRGLDNPESIKSVKDITHTLWEETLEIEDEEALATIDKSMRTPLLELDIHRHFFCYNPTDKTHWIYKKFYDEDDGAAEQYAFYRENAYYLNTTHKDNKFVSEIFVAILESEKISNPDRYLVDGLGLWGVLAKTGLFYKQFVYEKIVTDGVKKYYDINKSLYVTFDFNVFPYISCEISQLRFDAAKNELQMVHFDEICLTDSARVGKVQETCKEFLQRYQRHKGKVYICGDRSGNSRKTASLSDFATIFAMLRKTPPSEYLQERQGTEIVRMNPYPDYEQLGCTFAVVDITIKGANPRLFAREVFFERLHSGQIKILPLSRNFGTISANGEVRDLSQLYQNCRLVQVIDSTCIKLIKDYQEVRKTEAGIKDSSRHELTHTSDAADYLYCQLFNPEFNQVLEQLKL
jgi:hypothetical protein